MIVTPGNRGTKFGLQACPRYLQADAALCFVHVRVALKAKVYSDPGLGNESLG